jgi:hypothetical protein
MKHSLIAVLFSTLAFGCGNQEAAQAPVAAKKPAPVTAPVPEPKPVEPAVVVDAAPAPVAPLLIDAGAPKGPPTFADLSREDREKLMKQKVLPTLRAKFKAFDPKEFAKFNCKSCHGPGVEDESYEMPNPRIKKLDFAKADSWSAEEKKVAKFMHDEVVPAMAEIFGMKPYSKENPDGFGCLACHMAAGK